MDLQEFLVYERLYLISNGWKRLSGGWAPPKALDDLYSGQVKLPELMCQAMAIAIQKDLDEAAAPSNPATAAKPMPFSEGPDRECDFVADFRSDYPYRPLS